MQISHLSFKRSLSQFENFIFLDFFSCLYYDTNFKIVAMISQHLRGLTFRAIIKQDVRVTISNH